MNQDVIEKAKAIGQKYLDCFNLTGNYDLKRIAKALEGRTHNGKPVEIVVVASLDEAVEVIKKDPRMKGLSPWNCIWDYYLMAIYDALYSQCPDQSHEFGRQSFYEAFKEGLGYYINLGSFAVAIARPEAYRDPQMRIHREDGPAIRWGKRVSYWWHGVQVEADWIEHKDKVNPKLALTWENIEQRRALCEILGWDRVLKQLDCKSIHKDSFGELLQVTLPDAGLTTFVRVKCATGRIFCIPIPNTVKTAKEAVAMSYNVPTKMYDPEVRT